MPRFTLMVLLHVDPDHREDYERFEAEASRIMARHGGRIERRLATAASDDDEDVPDEVHLVTFPSPESFHAYRHDAALEPLGELRARAIRRTVVWHSSELPSFA